MIRRGTTSHRQLLVSNRLVRGLRDLPCLLAARQPAEEAMAWCSLLAGPAWGSRSAGGMRVTMSRTVTSHKWYRGPMCKNCYRRNNTEHRKQSKMAKTEDARTESGGDIPLVCLKVSAARCALPPIAPALSPPGHCLLAPATCAVGTQVIGHPTGAGGPEQPAA